MLGTGDLARIIVEDRGGEAEIPSLLLEMQARGFAGGPYPLRNLMIAIGTARHRGSFTVVHRGPTPSLRLHKPPGNACRR